jgi:DNA-binding NarL/FixJ family response regulator
LISERNLTVTTYAHQNALSKCEIYQTQIVREAQMLYGVFGTIAKLDKSMNLHIPKVMVIDHDESLHTVYKIYFESYLDYELTGIHATIKEALDEYDLTLPHIVLLEIVKPYSSGLLAIQQIKHHDTSAKIIVISIAKKIELIKKAFKYGAVGYLTKPVSQRTLYNALHAISSQGAFISNDVAKEVVQMFKRKSSQHFSERENEVIDFLQQGATYKYIAEKLFVTVSAINFHIQNIYLKLNVNNKSEALLKLAEMDKSISNH